MGCFSAAAVSVLSSMARPLSEDIDGDALDEWHDELWELLEASLNCFQANSAYYHMVPQLTFQHFLVPESLCDPGILMS